jgi:hypothetical protein
LNEPVDRCPEVNNPLNPRLPLLFSCLCPFSPWFLLLHVSTLPLAGGHTPAKELTKWLDERMARCREEETDHQSNPESLRLLYGLLKVAAQNYGKLRAVAAPGGGQEKVCGLAFWSIDLVFSLCCLWLTMPRRLLCELLKVATQKCEKRRAVPGLFF